jgi:glycosyltransferase involved in cell wall biosynthesis
VGRGHAHDRTADRSPGRDSRVRDMAISVIQPGARLHYAVPAIFARAGHLRALHTDIHGEHALLRCVDALLPSRVKTKTLRRLLGRRLPEGLPPRFVRDRPLETLLRLLAEVGGAPRHGTQRLNMRLLADLERSPIGEGDTVYTSLINEDIETMCRLKERGVKIVHECFIAPTVGRLLEAERRRFPGIEPSDDHVAIEDGLSRDWLKYIVSDAVFVPSDFVHGAVLEVAGAPPPRILKVPYGLDTEAIRNRPVRPDPGRILFVGSVGLRKGSHYFASAARELASRRPYTFVAVGPVDRNLLCHALMQGPTYRGQVPRTEVANEYMIADVFVLPTVCEGMALVHLEALAHGLPVVTTPACGSVITNGHDGFVVPVGDTAALVAAIRRIVEDRPLRAEMSRNARESAAAYSVEAYATRLLAAMREVASW